MAEYISRDKVLSYVYATHSTGGFKTEEDYLWLQEAVVDTATSDVQPVIHAKWILFDRDSVGRAFYCSNCRKVTTTDDYEDTPLDRDEYFCMRCGADMRSPDATKG